MVEKPDVEKERFHEGEGLEKGGTTLSINEVRVDGRIGKDADVRYTSGGSCVVKFSIANTERKKQGEQWVDGDTAWYEIEYWPKEDREAAKFKKGAYLCLRGRLKVDKWEHEGVKHSKVKIAMREVESWEFVKGGKPSAQSQPQERRLEPSRGSDDFDPNEYADDIPW
jgi:single-strand DNA-binding protein